MVCPKCNATVNNGARFCPNCGNPMNEENSMEYAAGNEALPKLMKTENKARSPWLYIIPAILVVLIFIGLLSGGSSKPRGKYILINPFTGGEAACITIRGNSYTNDNHFWGFKEQGTLTLVQEWDDCILYSVQLTDGYTDEFYYWKEYKTIEKGGEYYYKK